MQDFFTKAFENMNAAERESFYKTVFLQDDSEYAAKLRCEYYRTQLKSVGKNVLIGKNVKIVNPRYVSLGDGVTICDDCTLIARGEGGITLGDHVTLNDRVYLDTERPDDGYIRVEHDVYIGTGTTLFGHRGLEIGAGSVVVKPIPDYSVAVGCPARVIKKRGV